MSEVDKLRETNFALFGSLHTERQKAKKLRAKIASLSAKIARIQQANELQTKRMGYLVGRINEAVEKDARGKR